MTDGRTQTWNNARGRMAVEASPPGRLVYHLARRTWEVVQCNGVELPSWSAPPTISRQTLQAVSIRGGRSSHEEKQAWSNSTHLLLRKEPWSISRATEFAEIEQVVVVLSVSIGHIRTCTRFEGGITWSRLPLLSFTHLSTAYGPEAD